jgi:hypothetical protein
MPGRERQLTARDVIVEIVHNMREGLEQLLYSAVAPAVYAVFLHPEDFERLHPIASRIVEEARRALDEELVGLNGGASLVPARVRRLLTRRTVVARLADEWTIRLQPDPDGELRPGDIAVTSELTLPPRPQFEGTETRRVTTIARGEATQTSRQTLAAGDAARSAHAVLTYIDQQGPQTYRMDKDRIVIGRGGIGYWVDVKLQAAADVSREHLRIRRDPGTGGFFVKDVSSYGTTMNGIPLPRSVDVVDGQKRDLEIETPLPHEARLELAGMVVIEFRRQDS